MSKSIDAYENKNRVARYDADMDLMHPNRHKMVDVALEILPFPASQPVNVLDLGVGTGYFAARVLRQFAAAKLLGIDGSAAMIGLAGSRLSEVVQQGRVRFIKSRFQELGSVLSPEDKFGIVFSSYSLHHLDKSEKPKAIRKVLECLEPGGWFLNADLVSHPSPEIERAIQDVRVAGIHQRNQGKDQRFDTPEKIRAFLNNLEATEGDQLLSIEEDLGILRECGIVNATVFWKEYREVVYGGYR